MSKSQNKSKHIANKTTPEQNKIVKKNPFWFYIILVAIPFVFIILFEVLLRYFDYGYDFKYFTQISNYYPDKYFTNPDLPRKYFFNIKATPSVVPDGFDIVKKDNAFRIFVLGESSAAGWPYVPNASFPRHIKRKLELLYPENTIEVINLGISAINSYTLRDFAKGVVEMQPDLILIYTGHNEYYGALGVGSSVNMGYSRALVNFYLSIRDFRTTQFLQNIISGVFGIFKSVGLKGSENKETLMSRMIGESLIPFNSEMFNNGIDQFKGNMDDIFKIFSDKNIPVVIGNLTFNAKDQKPFVSLKDGKNPAADDVYLNAQREYESGNFGKANQLFMQAKELDALRFRAPQKINDAIYDLAKKYNLSVVNVDSVFQSNSPNGIVGSNLMVDHLHPTFAGYRILGDAYFKKMLDLDLLPSGLRASISESNADSILKVNFPFTRLDSTVAEMKVIQLKGSYPFVPKGTLNYKMLTFKPKDLVDTLAIELINNDIPWESAHGLLSDYYFKKGDYANCIKEIAVIIAERPYYDIPYKDLISKLVDGGKLDEAIEFLVPLYKLKPDYFATKWLGQVLLRQNKYKEALNYLQQAVRFKEVDSQTYYNLAGAYYLNKQNDEALAALQKSINLNPQNKLAINFYNQLSALAKKK
ncbi:MAG TPA: tetratricopeptide repeat protein [Ignavibacteriaceae bacterium]|mgnify:CR=1 FL=1|nr:tetratricopeptide repeat protein [Ignavibacteriaceae bacterium]